MGSWWVQRPLATCLPSWPSIAADWETGFSHQPAGQWRVSVWCLDATNIHFIDFSVPFCRAVGITETRYMRYPDRHLKVLGHVRFSLPLFYIIYSSFFNPPFFFLCQTHIHTPRCPLGQSKKSHFDLSILLTFMPLPNCYLWQPSKTTRLLLFPNYCEMPEKSHILGSLGLIV